MACAGPKATMSPILKQGTYRVAVLNFTSSGFLSSQKFGKFTADELANRMVLRKKAYVVDRSIVNAVVAQKGMRVGNYFTQNDMQNLAENLRAQIIILGEVRNIANIMALTSNRKAHLLITLRFLDPDSGAVLGIISHEKSGRDGEEKIIKEMIQEMVDTMGGFKMRDSGK